MVENDRFVESAYARLVTPESGRGGTPPPPPADPSKQRNVQYFSILLPDFVLHSRLICASGTILELLLESGEGDLLLFY